MSILSPVLSRSTLSINLFKSFNLSKHSTLGNDFQPNFRFLINKMRKKPQTRPIIGVLAQDNNSWIGNRLDDQGNMNYATDAERPCARLFENIEHGKGFANSTYVKWLITAGADCYIIPVCTTVRSTICVRLPQFGHFWPFSK